MLDHVLLDVIAALRRSFDDALLQRQAVEERFQVDVFLGDISWETSYSLPGEGDAPRVRVDLSLEWPTWSQSAYRSWSIGEPPDDLPELVIELALRVQRLSVAPPPGTVLKALEGDPRVANDVLERSGPTIEAVYGADHQHPECAVEVAYGGSWRLDEATLEDPSQLHTHLGGLGRWVASTLIRLADLDLEFLPAPHAEKE